MRDCDADREQVQPGDIEVENVPSSVANGEVVCTREKASLDTVANFHAVDHQGRSQLRIAHILSQSNTDQRPGASVHDL